MASGEAKRWYQTLFFWCATILFIPIAGFFGKAVHPENLTIWHEIEYWAVVGTFYTTCVGFVLFAKQYVHLLGSIGRQFSVVWLMCNVVAALYAMAVVDKWDRHLLSIAGIFLFT